MEPTMSLGQVRIYINKWDNFREWSGKKILIKLPAYLAIINTIYKVHYYNLRYNRYKIQHHDYKLSYILPFADLTD